MTTVSLNLNGKVVSADVPDNTLLVSFIRETMSMTGTHVGCDTSQCGACVVHLNGKAIKSCSMLAISAHGSSIDTIEGLSQPGYALHPMQKAFKENHGLQCGFCTPGMIMSAIAIVERCKKYRTKLDRSVIRHELEGNLCRCTGYQNIINSILQGAQQMHNNNQ